MQECIREKWTENAETGHREERGIPTQTENNGVKKLGGEH